MPPDSMWRTSLRFSDSFSVKSALRHSGGTARTEALRRSVVKDWIMVCPSSMGVPPMGFGRHGRDGHATKWKRTILEHSSLAENCHPEAYEGSRGRTASDSEIPREYASG